MPAAGTDTPRSAAMSGSTVTIVRPSSMTTNDSSQSSRGSGTKDAARGQGRARSSGWRAASSSKSFGRQEARGGPARAAPGRTASRGGCVSSPSSRSRWIAGARRRSFSTTNHVHSPSCCEQRPRVDVEGVGVEDARGRRIEAGRQTEVLEDHRAPVPAHGPAAAIAGRVDHLADEAGLVRQVPAGDGGVERGAEVVQVRQHQRPPARRHERVEQAGIAERVDQVAVALRVLGRPAGVVVEGVAAGRSRAAPRPAGRGRSPASQRVAERLADGAVGGGRRHREQRRPPAVAAFRRSTAQPDIEEREAVDGLDEGLHDPAHPRRHAARQHHEPDLAASSASAPSASIRRLLARSAPRQRQHVAGCGRLDGAFDDVTHGRSPVRS